MLQSASLTKQAQGFSGDNRSQNGGESAPFELLSEIVKKRVKLFMWSDRKLTVTSKRELLYYKKNGTEWVLT